MKFLYPQVLYALFALAIPVLIHLFQLRKTKTVYFSNLNFLKQVNQQTKKMSRLQHLLILLFRLLAFAFIILAFAQPFIPSDEVNEVNSRNVALYIDNSYSLRAENSEGALWDQAVNQAKTIVNAYEAQDVFYILSNEADLANQRWLNKQEAIDVIEDLEVGRQTLNLNQVLQKQLALLNNTEEEHVYWITDFQENMLSDSDIEFDSIKAKLFTVPMINEAQANVYIDSVAFESPLRRAGKSEQIRIRLKNSSNTAVQSIPVRLMLNGEQKAVASADCGAQSETWVDLGFQVSETGWIEGSIEIQDFPLDFDNKWYLSFFIPESYRVLEISDQPVSNFSKLFNSEENILFDSKSNNQVSLDSLSNYGTVIVYGDQLSTGLSAALLKFVETGGKLMLFPPAPSKVNDARDALAFLGMNNLSLDSNKQEISKVAFDHPLYQGVFEKESESFRAPTAKQYYKANIAGGIPLLSSRLNEPFLTWKSIGSGAIVFCHSPVGKQYSDFMSHAFFVPTTFNLAIYQSQQQRSSRYLYESSPIIVNGVDGSSDKPVELVKDNVNYYPDQLVEAGRARIFTGRGLSEDGHYKIVQNNRELAKLAFNQDRAESKLAYADADDLENWLAGKGIGVEKAYADTGLQLASAIDAVNKNKELWSICLALALFFLLLETLFLKLFKA